MFKKYQRLPTFMDMEVWEDSTDMTGVSISEADLAAGCPKPGDMIARNPNNHNDRWLVNCAYFEANYNTIPMA